jgi:anti-sigma regulatory factor (Ser/Thr protein kinase)
MKRLTERYRKWLIYRSSTVTTKKTPRYRELVTAWSLNKSERMYSRRKPTKPPTVLCFEKNADETIKHLAAWIEKVSVKPIESRHKEWVTRPKHKTPWINGYVDYSEIKEISTAASVIIAAEYDRAKTHRNEIPPAINLDRWSAGAFQKLFQMGFFETVGISEDVSDRFNQSGDLKTMRILSGSDATQLEAASQSILLLSEFIDSHSAIPREIFIALNTALSEAMSNVTRWAYPKGHTYVYRPVARWWVAATADRRNRTLTVVVYDQGASIPVTFSTKPYGKAFIDGLKRLLPGGERFAYEDDGAYIRHATSAGSTGSGQEWRGKGLPQMKELIDLCGSGSLRIVSRGGECIYEHGVGMSEVSRKHALHGTLIEWKLILPEVARKD